jgi:hypothetical protein
VVVVVSREEIWVNENSLKATRIIDSRDYS